MRTSTSVVDEQIGALFLDMSKTKLKSILFFSLFFS
jgi:hypothetical protein